MEESDAARATDLVHRALAVEEHGYYESVMRASVGRPMPSFILTLLERFDESREILDGLVRAARDYGDRSAAGVFLAERAWTRYRAGNAEGAEADASRGAPDRARGHPRPRPRADRGVRGGPRRHGAGAALRGARGDRGRAAAGRATRTPWSRTT